MSITAMGGPWSSRPCAEFFVFTRRSSAFAPPRQAARRGLLERLPASGEARICHEIFVQIERLLAGCRLYADRGAVRQKLPALLVILEVCRHDLIQHLLVHGRIRDRAENLDAPVEIARHHVGGGNVDRRLGVWQAMARPETIYPAVFQEATHDRLCA